MSRVWRGKIKAPRKILSATGGWDANWPLLERAIGEICSRNASNLSFEELYRTSYTLVLNKDGERLYRSIFDAVCAQLRLISAAEITPSADKLRSTMFALDGRFGSECASGIDTDRAILSKITQIEPDAAAAAPRLRAGIEFIENIRRIWQDHLVSARMIRDVFLYLERTIVQQMDLLSVHQMALQAFLDAILRDKDIITLLFLAIGDQITADRLAMNLQDNRAILRTCTEMLRALSDPDTNVSVFERNFLPWLYEQTELFCQRQSSKLLEQLTSAEYLAAQMRFRCEEASRVESFLAEIARDALDKIIIDCCIRQRLREVYEMPSGIAYLVAEDQLNDIHIVYCASKAADAENCLLNDFLASIIQKSGDSIRKSTVEKIDSSVTLHGNLPGLGQSTVSNSRQITADAISWIDNLINLHQKFSQILKQGLDQDILLAKRISTTFSNLVNKVKKSPENLSLFIDDFFKRGLKSKSDSEIEQQLSECLTLFTYLHDKDYFEKYYKLHLAKRLLYHRTLSEDAERSMIAKLRLEVGSLFTSRLEGMLNDMSISREISRDFKNHISPELNDEDKTLPRLNLSITVLSESHWPQNFATRKDINIPFYPELERIREAFQRYYMTIHVGRKLSWNVHLGTVEVRAIYGQRRYELTLSLISTLVLLMFNGPVDDNFQHSFASIISAFPTIPRDNLVRSMQSLACGRHRLLKKSSIGTAVSDDDIFSVNMQFSSSSVRIHVQNPSGTASSRSETEKERRHTAEHIEQERKPQIEACIVRIMKDRKRLEHNMLISQVIEQLSRSFKPDPLIIKRRIEGLIEREYIRRANEDMRVYEYIA